jgi:hypothetical protein
MTAAPSSWHNDLKIHPSADIFPPLPSDELQALAEDIKTHGLREKIKFVRGSDGAGFIVDGRNRLDAIELAGLDRAVEVAPQEYFEEVKLDDDAAIVDYVISANARRRHLTSEQKRHVVAKLLKLFPERSNLAIAKMIGVDDKTVASVRQEMEGRSEIPSAEKRTDTMGRQQSAHQPARKPNPPMSRERRRAAFEQIQSKYSIVLNGSPSPATVPPDPAPEPAPEATPPAPASPTPAHPPEGAGSARVAYYADDASGRRGHIEPMPLGPPQGRLDLHPLGATPQMSPPAEPVNERVAYAQRAIEQIKLLANTPDVTALMLSAIGQEFAHRDIEAALPFLKADELYRLREFDGRLSTGLRNILFKPAMARSNSGAFAAGSPSLQPTQDEA